MPDPLGMAQELDVWGVYRTEEKDYLLSAYAFETSETIRGSVSSIPGWMRIGDTYRLAEELDHARHWYERVLEVEPDNADALQRLAEIGSTG